MLRGRPGQQGGAGVQGGGAGEQGGAVEQAEEKWEVKEFMREDQWTKWRC